MGIERRWFRRTVVGRRMSNAELEGERLPKRLALPIFASDALSSVAYATEAALAVIIVTSVSSRGLVIPLSIAVALLLAIVVLSYRQTIHEYPSGGGGYVVAKENLGELAGLVAAASLLVDYMLTVAVSIVAGVVALASAVPIFASHAVALSLLSVLVLLLANLRGLRESGFLFAIPTYAFIVSLGSMITLGIFRGLTNGFPHAHVPDALPSGTASTIGLFVLLRAFASGCSALTGVEAISNGVAAFRAPAARNAARTLMTMAGIAIFFFLGVSYLAWQMDARPSSSVSVLSEIARAVFPAGGVTSVGYYAVQFSTFAVLFLAANAAYQGFPRLMALMSRDGYVPRQFQSLGDRLVYSNGLAVLSLLAALLIIVFDASIDSLIHLYLLGVFVAFTLSQTGMVLRSWRQLRARPTGGGVVPPAPTSDGLRQRIALNGVGALMTGLVAVITIVTKFTEGAWMVTIAIPMIVAGCIGVQRHYARVDEYLGSSYVPSTSPGHGPVVLLVERIDDATLEALRYAYSLVGRDFHPIHVSDTGGTGISRVWSSFQDDYPDGVPAMELLRRRGSTSRTIVEYVQSLPRSAQQYVTVVIPEPYRSPSVGALLQRRSTIALRLRLLRAPGVAVTDVPIVAGTAKAVAPTGETRRMEILVPISGINGVARRSLDYATTLPGDSARALYVDLDEETTRRLRADWAELHRTNSKLPMELQILESPYRDISEPLLREIRRRTADPNVVCMVVIPELLVSRWWHRILHNQRALAIKRALLFEERVIVTSIPFVIR